MSSLFKKAAEVVSVKEPAKEEVTEKEADAVLGTTSLVIEEDDVKLSKFEESASLLEEARAGRNLSDIPTNDPYWLIQDDHTLAHGKHSLRTDELDTVKGKPVKK